jgi:AraC-like DNA-binding protein
MYKQATNTYRRIYRHNSTQFPFELAHEHGKANLMKEFHWHNFLEITRIEAGCGTYFIEDKVIPVEQGDILIINNIERHRVEYCPEQPLYETVFHFDSEILSPFFQDQYNIFDYNSTLFCNKLSIEPEVKLQLKNIMDDIVDEFKRKETCYELCIKSALAYFIAIVLRHNESYKQSTPQRNRTRVNIARIENILKYISAHLEAETTLKSVSEHFFLNPTYFSYYFKRMMGVTFTEYIRELRISKAVQLLEKENMRIVDICYECGFLSTSAFYEAFSKVHGMSPQKYIIQKKRSLSR